MARQNNLESIESAQSSTYKSLSSGVYKSNESVLVLNRPLDEDQDSQIKQEELEAIFSGIDFSMFNETGNSSEDAMQSELFSLFTILILLFLTVEGFMTLRKPAIEVEAK